MRGPKVIALVCVPLFVAGLIYTAPQRSERAPTDSERAVTSAYRDLGKALVAHHLDDLARDQVEPPPAVGCADPWQNEIVWYGMEARSGQTHDGVTLAGPNWTGLLHDIPWGTLDHYRFTNSAIVNAEVWGARQYRVRSDVVFEDSTFDTSRREHSYYANVAGYDGGIPLDVHAISFIRCRFDSPGSQAIQLVYRPQEQGIDFEALGDGTPGGLILVEDCLIENAGWNQGGTGRASFALSFFWSLNNVKVSGTTVDNSMQAESRGAIMADSHGSVLVEDSRFLMGVTDRPIGLFERIGFLVIRDCEFSAAGGQANVKINDCGAVIIEGCTGNARLIMDGVQIGSIADGFTGPRPELPPGAHMPREVPFLTRETGIPVQ